MDRFGAARQNTFRAWAGIGSDPTVADESGAEGTLSIVRIEGGGLADDGPCPRAEIDSALERAEHLAASIEGSALSPRILELRGRLAGAVGDAPSSDRTLREALDLYRAIGATGHAERLAMELDA